MEMIGTMWSLLPSMIVLILAIKTKKLMESMLIGSVVAFIMLDGFMFWDGWVGALFEQLEFDSVIWVALTTFLLGAIIHLVQASGGSKSFTQMALKHAKSEKDSLLATVIFGLIIFVDDYLNALSVSSAMKKVTDKYGVPREMLGYTVTSVGAPVSTLVPFSSWGAYMVGLLGLFGYEFAGDALTTYVKSIPYMMYSMVAVVVCVLVIVGVIPKFGGMKKAYARVAAVNANRAAGMQMTADGAVAENVFQEGSENEKFEDEEDNKQYKLINFVLPVTALVLGTIFMFNDLLYGLIISIIVAIVLYSVNKTMSYSKSVEACFDGAKNMLDVWVIILFAYIFIAANTRLELAEYVITNVEPLITPALLPAIAFATIGAIAFVTGSFWELAALAFPIMVPLGLAVDANIYMVIASVVGGTVFGSTACFYSDTDILVAQGCDIKMMDMAPKMLPYFIICYAATIVGYLILGVVF